MSSSDKVVFEEDERVSFFSEMKKKIDASVQRKFLRKKRQVFNNIDLRKQMVVFADDHVSNEVLCHGVFEKKQLDLIFKWMAKKEGVFNTTVLDIGANIGNHSLSFAEHYDKCISFEPNPRTYSVLKLNSELVSNIHPKNIGLSDHKGELPLFTDFKNVGASSLRQEWNKSIDSSCVVPLDTLDNVIASNERIGLIKIDVEGYEWFVLKGGEKTIRREKPIILFEHKLESMVSEAVSEDVISLLQQFGYTDFYEISEGRDIWEKSLKTSSKFIRPLFQLWFYVKVRKFVHRIVKIQSFDKKEYDVIIACRE